MLHGLCNMTDRGNITASTRRYVYCTDGGSENRAKNHHALNYTLVDAGVFEEVLWGRLPPHHSHDFVDRVFSAVESWLGSASHRGCNTPWDLRNYLLESFAHADSQYAGTDVQVRTHPPTPPRTHIYNIGGQFNT